MSGRNRETEENADTVPSAENGKARFEQPLLIHLEKKTFPAHKSLARLFKHTTINGKNLSKKKKTRKEDKVSPEGPQRAYPPLFPETAFGDKTDKSSFAAPQRVVLTPQQNIVLFRPERPRADPFITPSPSLSGRKNLVFYFFFDYIRKNVFIPTKNGR